MQEKLPTPILALITATTTMVTKQFHTHPAEGMEEGNLPQFLVLHGEAAGYVQELDKTVQELEESVRKLQDDVGGAGLLTGSDLTDLRIMIG
jgi:hypothetical protein